MSYNGQCVFAVGFLDVASEANTSRARHKGRQMTIFSGRPFRVSTADNLSLPLVVSISGFGALCLCVEARGSQIQ